MNINDFRFMWRGKIIQLLSQDKVNLLQPIDKRSQKKERALLLLHGFSSSPGVYRKLYPALTSYDAIVCPALPGHCHTIASFSTIKANDWVNAANEVCDKLVNEYKKVDVLGLSLGGVLACNLSNLFAINHLYLLAPALELRVRVPMILYLTKILKHLGVKNIRNKAGDLYCQEEAELAYYKIPLSTIMEILNFINTFKFKAPTCKTDIFLGVHDAVVNSTKVAKYFKNLNNCKTHWLNNSAHVLPLDGDLNEIIACINKNCKSSDA